MKQIIPYALAMCAAVPAQAGEIVRTDAYVWHGDTVTQGEYMATAPNDFELVSTYSAQPGYFMPVEKSWKLKNDISSYPGDRKSVV